MAKNMRPSALQKEDCLIEISWGKPHTFIISPEGDIQNFSTIEQVRYWLLRKWPIADEARTAALRQVEAAMDCIVPVATARRAFLAAAKSAGFEPQDLVAYPSRHAA